MQESYGHMKKVKQAKKEKRRAGSGKAKLTYEERRSKAQAERLRVALAEGDRRDEESNSLERGGSPPFSFGASSLV